MERTKTESMVVKGLLEANNAPPARFKQFCGKTPAARRRLYQMQGGGIEISAPQPCSNDQIRETLKVKLAEVPELCVSFMQCYSLQNLHNLSDCYKKGSAICM